MARKIRELVWDQRYVEKIKRKHNVSIEEVEEAWYEEDERGWFLRADRRAEWPDVLYRYYGTTSVGRYLFVVLLHIGSGKGLVISARDMEKMERRRYIEHIRR